MNISAPDHPVKPDLSPQLLALLHQHRDLTRRRLVISRQIAEVERQIRVVETNTRRAVSPSVVASAS